MRGKGIGASIENNVSGLHFSICWETRLPSLEKYCAESVYLLQQYAMTYKFACSWVELFFATLNLPPVTFCAEPELYFQRLPGSVTCCSKVPLTAICQMVVCR